MAQLHLRGVHLPPRRPLVHLLALNREGDHACSENHEGGGTYFFSVIRELRDPSYGLKATKFREVSRSRINRELASGALVVCADDQLGLDYGHIITVIEDLGVRYMVVDRQLTARKLLSAGGP